MTPREIFALYAQERRSQEIEGCRLEVLPCFSRYTPEPPGRRGCIAFNRIPQDQVAAQIEEQSRYFAEGGFGFEWKVYDFDEPPNLRQLLEARGFTAEHPEAFLVLPLDGTWEPAPPVPGVRMVKAEDAATVQDAAAVQRAVWGKDLGWLEPALLRRVRERPDRVAIYVAYAGREPIGTGWIDLEPGSAFADLHGGAVLPRWRGRGVYSLLLHRRRQEARERGYRYLAVDAAPMSRPILERKGFRFICHTYPMDRRTWRRSREPAKEREGTASLPWARWRAGMQGPGVTR